MVTISRMRIVATALAVALTMMAVPTHAEIYKCMDSSGTTVYSDKPCDGGSRSPSGTISQGERRPVNVNGPTSSSTTSAYSLPQPPRNAAPFTLPRLDSYLPPERRTLPPLVQTAPPKEPSAYDRLTPEERAEVDEKVARQIELERCKVGIFGQYYQECILDRMPAAKNPIAAGDVMRLCRKTAPCSDVRAKKTGLISNTTAAECFKKHGYNITLPMAAANIRSACYDLYPDD